MATTTVLAPTQVSVKAGPNTYGGPHGFAVAAGILNAIIDTGGNPAGIQYTMDVLWSQDNGQTWNEWGTFFFSSDPATDKQGNPITTHNISGDWPGTRMQINVTASAASTCTLSATLS